MNADACLAFARSMGIADAEISDNSMGETWVRGTCQMGWLHEGGKDKHPSFGIRVSEDGESYYFCFAHGGGSLQKFIHTMTWHRNHYHKEACDILNRYENSEDPLSVEYKDKYADQWSEWKKVKSISLDYFNSIFPPVQKGSDEEAFLIEDRIIPRWVIDKYGVRSWDGYTLFPVLNPLGGLMAVVVRNIYTKKFQFLTAKWTENSKLDFPSLYESGNFFGEQFARFGEPVMVVESALEACTLVGYGFDNVIATCGNLNRHQLDRLGMYDPIYIGTDADYPGDMSASKIVKRYRNTHSLSRIHWGHVGVSDPGEITSKEQLAHVIESRGVL